MARVYKTARGRSIDMDKVKLANETATAVGNMRVNARGDLIGAGGQVTAGRNQLMDKVYAVPEAMYSPNSATSLADQNKVRELHELATTLAKPAPVEPVVDENASTPARGSLASSVAKKVSVTQETLPDTRPGKGPSRI
jgi:hypothetical protein